MEKSIKQYFFYSLAKSVSPKVCQVMPPLMGSEGKSNFHKGLGARSEREKTSPSGDLRVGKSN